MEPTAHSNDTTSAQAPINRAAGVAASRALTMTKTPAPIEIVNDLDDEIVNVFEQLRNNSDELVRQIELTPYAHVEHARSRSPPPTDSGLERARKFLVQAMMSINGVVGGHQGGFSTSNTYTREGREPRVNRWRRYPERLAAVIERLKDVRVEHQEAGKLLGQYAIRSPLTKPVTAARPATATDGLAPLSAPQARRRLRWRDGAAGDADHRRPGTLGTHRNGPRRRSGGVSARRPRCVVRQARMMLGVIDAAAESCDDAQ